jgi:excisionase family DNA binding protein
MNKENKEFYSCEELAEKLQVNIMTIYRYIDKGKIEAYKIGRHYRISNNEFIRFLESIKIKSL